MAKVIPKTAYKGVYGEEAAGKSATDVKGGAANDFASAEKSASKVAPQVKDKTTSSSTDVAEKGGAGHTPKYSGGKSGAAGGTMAAAAKMTPMGRMAGMFRGGGGGSSKKPLIAMGGTTGLIALVMMMVSSLLPVHLVENMVDLRNSFSTVSEVRGNRLVRVAIGNDNLRAVSTWSKRNTMSPRRVAQMNRGLASEGLRLTRASDGNISMQAATIDANGRLDWNNTVARTDAEFTALVRDNPNVRNGFNRGTRTWRGRVAGWFTTPAARFLGRFKMTRNLFDGFVGRHEGNTNFREAQSRLAGAEQRVRTNDIQMRSQHTNEIPGTDGAPATESDIRPNADNVNRQGNRAQAEANARVRVAEDIRANALRKANRASSVVGIINAGAMITCAVSMAVAAVSAVMAAQQMAQALQVVAGWFEAGQKVMAGDGDDSYHAFGTALTERQVTTTLEGNTVDEDTVADESLFRAAAAAQPNEIVLHNGEPRSATESAGLTQVLVGGAFSAERDPSAMRFHAEQMIGFLALSTTSISVCASLMFAGALAGMITEIATLIISFVPIFGQAFKIGALIKRVATQIAVSAAIATAMGIVVSRIVPVLARMWVTEIATDVGGEDFGNMIASVGGRYMSGMHQANGGVVATEERAWAYFQETQRVLAEWGELEREDRSPFDITNRHTFLGSIAFNLSGFAATSTSTLFGQFSGLSSMARISRMPWQFSADANSRLRFQEQLGNCPNLSSLYPEGIPAATNPNTGEEIPGMRNAPVHSVACDPFGNPMRINDLGTVEHDPEFIFWKTAYTCDGNECSFGSGRMRVDHAEWVAAGNRSGPHMNGGSWSLSDPNRRCSTNANSTACNGVWYEVTRIDTDPATGVERINPASELGKMVRFGVYRNTDPGVADANILQELEGNTGPGWLSWVPIAGDIQGMVVASRQENALRGGWVDGSIYCAGCRPETWDSKHRYLNQYIVDVGIYEGMEALERNPVTAFFDEHIWPTLDMSPNGIIARNMGWPKEWVDNTIAFAHDLFDTPRDIFDKIASAPNIWFTYYGGSDPNELQVPEQEQPSRIIATLQEGTRISGVELRRRFNSEAVA